MDQREATTFPSQSTTTSDASPPTHVRYFVLAAACSLAVLTYLQRQGYQAGAPEIRKALNLDYEKISNLASIWLIAYGLFQIPGGMLGDRFGARHLLTALVLGWSLLIGAIALADFLPVGAWQTLGFLLVARFLFGMFQAGGFPVLARVLADWMPIHQRGFAQGLVWALSRLGGFAASFLYLWLYRTFDNQWAPPFWVLACLGIVWCAFFWPWFRNRPDEMQQTNAAERALIAAGRSAPSRPGPFPWRAFLKSRNVWALSLIYGFGGFGGNFITGLLAVYLRDSRKLDQETTAWVFGLPLAFGIFSCLCGGVLSDWLIRRTGNRIWGRRLVGGTSLALAGVMALSVIWIQDVRLLGLAFCAWFFFNDGNMGPSWASCADVGERHAGSLSGAMNMTGSLFGAVGAWLAGRLFHLDLDYVVFILYGIGYALAALCWLAVDVTKPLVPKVEPAGVDG